jgi:hypothetical protein
MEAALKLFLEFAVPFHIMMISSWSDIVHDVTKDYIEMNRMLQMIKE